MTVSSVDVNIRTLAFGGAGVGEVTSHSEADPTLLGISAFVPFTIPGEQVRARVSQRKKRYLEGELEEVLTASPDRVTPECRHFSQCGGCELQHISYSAQLNQKMEMVRGAMQAGRLPYAVMEVLRPVVGGSAYNYRRRVALHLDQTGRVGFYRTKSRSIIALEECPISEPQISAVLPTLRDLAKQIAKQISSIVIEADENGLIAVLRSPYDLNRTDIEMVLAKAKKFFSNVVLLSAGKDVGGFGRKVLELPLPGRAGLKLFLAAGAFSQVNWQVNQLMLKQALELAKPKSSERICDLYAGAGNFSLPFAASGAKVIAVECEPRLVAMGRQSAERYRLDIEYVESSVEKFLAQRGAQLNADLVIADPPRSGLGELVKSINLAPRMILISCHLPSLVRDLHDLIEVGWRVELVQPFDMFAQTTYLEILVLLERS